VGSGAGRGAAPSHLAEDHVTLDDSYSRARHHGKDDTELFKQFMDNESFRRWMTDTVFGLMYGVFGAMVFGGRDGVLLGGCMVFEGIGHTEGGARSVSPV
jgi:hypothetical protein